MKKLCLVVLLALGGCAYNVTLYPRGGGEQAIGKLDSASFTITVELNGETYSGRYIAGQSFGFATSGAAFASGIGMSNQRSALLKGPHGVIRCDFSVNAAGGNGLCQDSQNVVYDMLIDLEQ